MSRPHVIRPQLVWIEIIDGHDPRGERIRFAQQARFLLADHVAGNGVGDKVDAVISPHNAALGGAVDFRGGPFGLDGFLKRQLKARIGFGAIELIGFDPIATQRGDALRWRFRLQRHP